MYSDCLVILLLSCCRDVLATPQQWKLHDNSSIRYGNNLRMKAHTCVPFGCWVRKRERNMRQWVILNSFSNKSSKCIQDYFFWKTHHSSRNGILFALFIVCSISQIGSMTTRWTFVNSRNQTSLKVSLTLRLSQISTLTLTSSVTRTFMWYTSSFGSLIMIMISSWAERSSLNTQVTHCLVRLLREFSLKQWKSFSSRRRWALETLSGS